MNKTYKVIFSKSRGLFAAVSEAACSTQAKGSKTIVAAAAIAALSGGVCAEPITTPITSDTTFTADAEYAVTGDSVVKGAYDTTPVVNLNGFNAAFSSTGKINQGVIYNAKVTGNGTEALTLKSENGPGLGTGTNVIENLGSLTVTATGDSVKGITGYGNTTISNVKNIRIESEDDAVHVMGDAGGRLKITGFEKLELIGGEDSYGLQDASSVEGHSIEIQGAENSYVRIQSQSAARAALKSQGSAADITISASKVTLEGAEGGALNVVKAKNVSIQADETLTFKATGTGVQSSSGTVSLAGGTVNIEGNTGLKLSGNGAATITAGELTINGSGGTAVKAGEYFAGSLTLKGSDETTPVKANINGNVSVEGGTLAMNGVDAYLSEGSTFTANTLSGSDSAVYLSSFAEEGPSVSVETLSAEGFSVMAAGSLNDQYASAEEMAKALQDAVEVTTPGENSVGLGAEAGSVSDGFTVAEDGTVTATANPSLAAVSNFSALTLTQWRAEMNHISQRLGDVRANDKTIGAWARLYGYESTTTDTVTVKAKARSVQAGGDWRVTPEWLVGAAFSYTDVDAEFSNGSGTSDGYSLAAYASGFFPCGGYVDIVGRVGRLSSEVTAATGTGSGGILTGDYDNTALGLSIETGYHFALSEVFYVEPQVELAYGLVLGDDFTSATNGVTISQDDFESLVGRLGARFGGVFAEGRGQVYAQASVNHDFMGNADATATPASGVSRTVETDLSGTWVSFGVGAQFDLENNLSFYGSLERAESGDYDEDYRYSVGMRYAF